MTNICAARRIIPAIAASAAVLAGALTRATTGNATMKTQRNPQRQQGFNLLELLVTLSIVAILAAIAVPSFDYLNNRRVTQTQVENLQRALMMARQTALAKNRQVTLCPSSDGNACTDTQDWSSGYLVFVDVDENETFERAAGDLPIEFVYGVRNVAARSGSSHVGHRLVANSESLQFNKAGFNNNGFTNTFRYCDAEGTGRFRVRVLNTGRVKVEESADSCD